MNTQCGINYGFMKFCNSGPAKTWRLAWQRVVGQAHNFPICEAICHSQLSEHGTDDLEVAKRSVFGLLLSRA